MLPGDGVECRGVHPHPGPPELVGGLVHAQTARADHEVGLVVEQRSQRASISVGSF